ncbi:type I restriction enzyme HsdR N-terminal domain-containing protein [Rhodothermus profundi]|uniref:Type I restriction enzyme R protein N terminus (HSDR_N) n=1 Tax=Rhodothermus profundi TaxID=633813 RepID=A0A1M6WQN4_9BACT|nr:type I restriction enzyme HsdR N-terminal domain-containing protein [Rhodothermus profundi]SHK96080.1 Type I restriction enzyme R protein N terminus (HSDR_N) [Rhodothermus profundi]
MEALNFPAYSFRLQRRGGQVYLLDPLRRRWVRLTPEEWVRQHLAQYLVQALGCPPSLVALEVSFADQGMARRADLLVYDRQGRPLLLAECKAPSVSITQEVVEQAGRYNRVVRAPYLLVTNGQVHYAWRIDSARHTMTPLTHLPSFAEMIRRM